MVMSGCFALFVFVKGSELRFVFVKGSELRFVFVKDRLVGLVVKASALRAEGPGFKSR